MGNELTQNELYTDNLPVQTLAQITSKDSKFVDYGSGLTPDGRTFYSANYQSNVYGWFLDTQGSAQFNGNKIVSTHFTPVFSTKGITFYVSDGTTPNGNLSGTAGDICFGADSGKAYKCTSSNTWLSFT